MRSRVLQDKTQYHPKNVYNQRFVPENSDNDSATKASLKITTRISQHHNGYFSYLT